MLIISHRGNLTGPSSCVENSPESIERALSLGLDVEIDVWEKEGNFYLGHDSPTYKIEKTFLTQKRLWCHAKNIAALQLMLDNRDIHCFWHQKDTITLTSRGIIWCFPGTHVDGGISLFSLPPNIPPIPNILGICTDFAGVLSQ